ncbi:hypothetical protein Tco_0514968 [Tanacetum coccineum]
MKEGAGGSPRHGIPVFDLLLIVTLVLHQISGGHFRRLVVTNLDMSMYVTSAELKEQSEEVFQTTRGYAIYHASIKVAPFEALYGRKCHSPVCWAEKCYSDEPLAFPLEGLHVDDKLRFVEEPIEIMDSCILIVKVQWNSRRGPEFTWEREDKFQKKYSHLFTKPVPSSSVAT